MAPPDRQIAGLSCRPLVLSPTVSATVHKHAGDVEEAELVAYAVLGQEVYTTASGLVLANFIYILGMHERSTAR